MLSVIPETNKLDGKSSEKKVRRRCVERKITCSNFIGLSERSELLVKPGIKTVLTS